MGNRSKFRGLGFRFEGKLGVFRKTRSNLFSVHTTCLSICGEFGICLFHEYEYNPLSDPMPRWRPGSISPVPFLRSLGVDTVVAHWSLLELASIKAADDEIRCGHGNVEKLPPSWGTYDAVFFGHSPAKAFTATTLFESFISRCRAGKFCFRTPDSYSELLFLSKLQWSQHL